MNEIVSIIVPIYNVERYLVRCLESIINQSYANLEIILVDDGSTDGSGKICDKYGLKDSRIKVIHRSNGGLSAARNSGLSVASGEYIAFVDSDDYIDSNMVESMFLCAQKNNATVVTCGRMRVSGDCFEPQKVVEGEKVVASEEAIRQIFIGGYISEAVWDKLFKREAIINKRFPEGEINEDIELVIAILGDAEKIVYLGEALYFYCENEGSITRSGYKHNKMIMLKHLRNIEDYICRKYPHIIHEFYVLSTRYMQEVLYLLLSNKSTYVSNKDDYDKVYATFRKHFKEFFFDRNIGVIDKMKGLLILLGLYLPIHSMIHKRD
ncbi:glycosyltransferase [Butyrivibrio sp. FCS014]|uniref:glycosyltransferase n=1 Tax=Butyrivibrio sp. FCS014 TaxID=1408304 RepID=UPI0004641D96|nr:glycosyltransferase [Butyrivibrio sp. FCS014]